MLSKRECLDYLNLTEDELAEVIKHDNLQVMMAIKKCSCLLDSPEGILYLHTVFLDNFNEAYNKGQFMVAQKSITTYQGFAEKYPLPNYLSSR